MSAATTSKIPNDVKREIYRILSDNFDFEIPIPMARVGSMLIDAGVDKSEYGYKSFKSFCLDLGDFLTIDEMVKGRVPQLIVTLHRSTKLQKALTEKTPAPKRSVHHETVGGELTRFAVFDPWTGFLAKLAEAAQDEPWTFGESKDDYEILDSYIRFTFYRLQLEDKVCIADNDQFAAFNTGLVDDYYDDIYACFKPSGEEGREWRFMGICTAGSRSLGKRLVAAFNPLPQPASYFQTLEDLLFDLDKDLICDYRHIILDNISRLPVSFLKDEFRGDTRIGSLLGNITGEQDADARDRLYGKLVTLIEDDQRLFNRLRDRLADAVRSARRQVRWNYRMAMPSYNPRTNSMSLLLPLALVNPEQADVALVVTPVRSGNYQGHTILTMRQAYIDARLICQLRENWLLDVDGGN